MNKNVTTIKLSDDTMDLLECQRQAFRRKFGREPGPDDPVIFDPDSDEPRPLTEEKYQQMMVVAMRAAGIDPAIIFAFRRTGQLVTEANLDRFSDEELEDWWKAIQEYRALLTHGFRPA